MAQKFHIDREKVVWRTVDGEAVILNLDDGLYYTLNEVGTLVWEGLAVGAALQEIANNLTDQYNVGIKQAQCDIKDLITRLNKTQLVEATD